jgi:hypothetical protein
MEMSKAAEAHCLYRNYELMCEAIATLQKGGALYSYCAGSNQGFNIPEETRGDLVRHFQKNKAVILAEITAL